MYFLAGEISYVINSQPFPKQKILDSIKLKEFADNIFECHENSRKLQKW